MSRFKQAIIRSDLFELRLEWLYLIQKGDWGPESEVFTGNSQTEIFPHLPSDSEVEYTENLRLEIFPVKTEGSRLISCLLYDFLLCFGRPVIGPCALRENNAVKLANQRARYIRQKHKPDNNVGLWVDGKLGFISATVTKW